MLKHSEAQLKLFVSNGVYEFGNFGMVNVPG